MLSWRLSYLLVKPHKALYPAHNVPFSPLLFKFCIICGGSVSQIVPSFFHFGVEFVVHFLYLAPFIKKKNSFLFKNDLSHSELFLWWWSLFLSLVLISIPDFSFPLPLSLGSCCHLYGVLILVYYFHSIDCCHEHYCLDKKANPTECFQSSYFLLSYSPIFRAFAYYTCPCSLFSFHLESKQIVISLPSIFLADRFLFSFW